MGAVAGGVLLFVLLVGWVGCLVGVFFLSGVLSMFCDGVFLFGGLDCTFFVFSFRTLSIGLGGVLVDVLVLAIAEFVLGLWIVLLFVGGFCFVLFY
ncbi:hypothetical protein EB14_02262 [Enterococcus faecium]|nr:hypothetical protein EB14_02262 [Enterococcus faecium]